MTLRIAVLVKQIPVAAEMNAYGRRAVAKAVELANEHGGECTVVTLGPEPAEDVLREALASADAWDVVMRGVHACDPLRRAGAGARGGARP